MANRLMKTVSWWATAVGALGLMIFYYNYQGYTPASGNDTLIAWAIVGTIALAYLGIEYLEVKVEMSKVDMAMETFLSYLPVMALSSVLTAWKLGAIMVSSFQFWTGVVFLVVVLVDVLGFTSLIFDNMMSTFAAKPKAASK